MEDQDGQGSFMEDQDGPQYFETVEEATAYALGQQQKAQMASEVAKHDVVNLLSELSKEHLLALQGVIDFLQVSPHAQIVAGFYAGYITAEIQRRFDICAACGQNHHEVLLSDPTVS